MKKVLFSLALVASFCVINAQTVLFEDDFESYSPDPNVGEGTMIPDGYISYDVNGDGLNWGLSNPDFWTQAMGDIYSGNFLISVSYVTGGNYAVDADNIIVLPLISIPEGASDVELTYFVGSGTDTGYFSETYDVIVTTENTQDAILSATPIYTETLPEQGGSTRSVSLDDFVGQDIYISFYHRDTYDQWVLGIDDIQVVAETLSTTDVNKTVSSIYPNPVVDSFNVNLSPKYNASNVSISITDLTGRVVKSLGNSLTYDISELPKGVYLLNITDGSQTETKKIIKK